LLGRLGDGHGGGQGERAGRAGDQGLAVHVRVSVVPTAWDGRITIP